MYPVIIRRLADLRAGDRIVAHSGVRYPQPLNVVAPLGPIPNAHGRGVRVVNPTGQGEPEWVLYPWQTDGQVLDIDRPDPGSLPTNAGIDVEHPSSGVGLGSGRSC